MCNKHELFLFCCCGFYTRHDTTYNANNTAFFLRLPLCFFLLLLRRNQMYTIVLSEAILTTTIATTVAAKTFVRLANALRFHLLIPINSSFSWYIWRFFPPIHKFYGKCDFHCHYHQLSMYQIRQYVHSNQTVREWDLFFWIWIKYVWCHVLLTYICKVSVTVWQSKRHVYQFVWINVEFFFCLLVENWWWWRWCRRWHQWWSPTTKTNMCLFFFLFVYQKQKILSCAESALFKKPIKNTNSYMKSCSIVCMSIGFSAGMYYLYDRMLCTIKL